jgi:hypothetical protein
VELPEGRHHLQHIPGLQLIRNESGEAATGLDADAEFQRFFPGYRTNTVRSPHWFAVNFYLNGQMLSGQEFEFAFYILRYLQ